MKQKEQQATGMWGRCPASVAEKPCIPSLKKTHVEQDVEVIVPADAAGAEMELAATAEGVVASDRLSMPRCIERPGCAGMASREVTDGLMQRIPRHACRAPRRVPPPTMHFVHGRCARRACRVSSCGGL